MFDPDLKRVSICLSTQFLQRYPNTKIEHELSAEVQYAKTGNDLHQNIEKMFQGLHKKIFLSIRKAHKDCLRGVSFQMVENVTLSRQE